MTSTENDSQPTSTPAHRGPNPAVLAGLSLLFVVAGVALSAATGGVIPSPFGDPAGIAAYIAGNPAALTVSAFFQFAAAVPLAIYAAVAYSRQRHLGVSAAGPAIGLVGGITSAAMLAASGLVTWVLALPAVSTAGGAVVLALHGLMFATGGVGAVAFLGLLVAGVAVPGLLSGRLPRTFALVGIAIAAVAVLSTVSMLASGLAILLPLGRFPGLIWLIVAGVVLPRRK
ncbi:DUF4386 domain-containing protein [Pseudonocardia sp. CA-107938]|uniref:DUF4386 domain-containing protein n=1 Tax=Pseudonocardia sp. CA-107938 TaxID=3240021 RepID=UPI003D8FD929